MMPNSTLETPVAGLLATPPARLPFQANVLVRSFFLERPNGNVLIYNSTGITSTVPEIESLGGATRLLLNHEHEAMFGAPNFDVPAYVHERDRAATEKTIPITDVFTTRQMIDHDLEVIPTPGHTPGTTTFLWDNGSDRFLFTGDFIWIEHGEWKAVVLDPGARSEYLDSLALIRDLDFTVLVPWGTTDDVPCFALTNKRDTRERIGAIINRVKAGSNR
jgi:hypothetical protein